jgi:drug/metabolite transporter (DMT)-like permease
MQWFYYASSSIAFFSVMNLLQRRIAVDSKYTRAASVVFNVFGAMLAVILFFLLGGYRNFILPRNYLAWVFMFIAALFYGLYERGRFVSAKLLDASTLSVVAYVSLVVAFIGSLFLYNETLTLAKVFGSLLIVISLILVSIQNNVRKKITLKGILICVGIFTFLGLAWMLDKKGATFFEPNTYSIFVWTVPLAIIYFPYVKTRELVYELRLSSWRFVILAGLNVVGYYLQLQALKMADATRVIPLIQLSTLVTVILGILLLGEKDNIWRKIIAAIIGLAGAYILIVA